MRVWISAGEISGDRLAARLVDALGRQNPSLEFAGLAGPAMRAAGVDVKANAMDFALSGWSSVAPRLPWLVWNGLRMLREAKRFRPDLAVVVDSPGLHRPVLRAMRREGTRCAWLAPPQLWAWRDRVVPELRGLEAYPLHRFEAAALEKTGAHVHWFGFPGERRSFSFDDQVAMPNLALLPGSRPSWRARHEDLFREAAERAALPLRPIVAIPDGICPKEGEGNVGDVLRESALALALPGTGVLEAALAGVPSVVAARPGAIDSWIARRRLVEGRFSLPNRILAEDLIPECLGNPTAIELADRLRSLWESRDAVRSRLARLHEEMGPQDAMDSIADDLLEGSDRIRQ